MNPIQNYLYNQQRRSGPRPLLCYSPSTSLYFGTDGNVSSCCYNREPLGCYPTQSIREIWEGRARQTLCKRIAADDLGGACNGCGSQIETGNFGAVVAQHFDRWTPNSDHPTSLSFELHNACNLECIMCNGELSSRIRRFRERRPALPQAYGQPFVDELEEFIPHLEGTTFYGGEPFVMRLYYRIWERLIALNPDCEITIQTNASILPDQARSVLERGNVHIGISLDSVRRDTYCSIRRNADFDTVMANTRWLADYSHQNNRPIGISACIMTVNWQELVDLLEFADELGAVLYFNTVWEPEHLSLAYAAPTLIQRVIELYGTLAVERGLRSPTHAAATLTSTNLAGYVALLSTWYQAAIRRETEGKLAQTTALV
ncbi:radical SAM protein [uncultured Ruegeria sp.]|uniref:radical SAM protein n=1 Tax=uncultured Ruegeria sp. TaxID=259304 RepID=UPI0026140367|nr:radical SAM protein [uncultured Ruegeria sp.]